MGVPQLADLVLETANAPGTGAFTLGGAPDGRQTFADAFPNGGDVYYYASDGVQSEWGVGTLTVGNPNVLVRKTIIGNLFGTTSALNFTSGVTVYCEVPAKKMPSLDDDGQLPVSGSPNFTRDVAVSAKAADFRYIRNNNNYLGGIVSADMDKLGVPSLQDGAGNWHQLQPYGDYPTKAEVNLGFLQLSDTSEQDVDGPVAFGSAITVQNATAPANPVSLGQLNDRISLELPVGIPQAWPLDTPPSGWLILNGASFDVTQYPKLAIAFPSGVLPDMRGKFIRGWDNGANLDPNDGQNTPGTSRALLSVQSDALQNITGSFGNSYKGTVGWVEGAFCDNGNGRYYDWGGSGSIFNLEGAAFDASRVARTSTETRPKNMAWNMIVRAA